jgi:pimeloyl-ACP methyl ester carboxylesterase
MPRTCILFAVVWLTLSACALVLPGAAAESLESATVSAQLGHLLEGQVRLDQLRARGPFAVTVQKNHELHLSAAKHIDADLFLPQYADNVPLVILLHGQDNSKETHANQAAHLASWGIACLALQLPNNGPWIDNGRTLATLANLIHRRPDMVDRRVDPNRIILAGHSFGGSAVAVALAEGARAVGAILLDPAAADDDLPLFLNQVTAPVRSEEHTSELQSPST